MVRFSLVFLLLAGCGAFMLLTGCGSWNQTVAHFTGHSESCISGVEYLIFPYAVTVKYTPEGKVATCN